MSNDSSKAPAAAKVSQAEMLEQYRAVAWGPWRGFFMIAVAFIGGQVAAVGLSLVPWLFGWSSHEVSTFLRSTLGQFLAIVASYGFAGLFLWLLLRQRKAASWKAIGLPRTWHAKDIGWATLGFLVYYGLFIVVSIIAGAIFTFDLKQQQENGFDSIVSVPDLLMAFVSLVVLPPFVEEILFRGVLFGGLRRRLSFVWATLLTSAVFALPHLLEAKSGGLLWIAGVDTFVLSFVLCYLREKTGSLWASIFLHGIKNCLAFLVLFVFVR